VRRCWTIRGREFVTVKLTKKRSGELVKLADQLGPQKKRGPKVWGFSNGAV
jgi:hypothetical protein